MHNTPKYVETAERFYGHSTDFILFLGIGVLVIAFIFGLANNDRD